MQIVKNATFVLFLQSVILFSLGVFLLIDGWLNIGILLLLIGSLGEYLNWKAADYFHQKDIHINRAGFSLGIALSCLTLAILGYLFSILFSIFVFLGIMLYLYYPYFIRLMGKLKKD